MSNEEWQARESAEVIRALLNYSPSNTYRTSYNDNESWFEQMLEVYTQRTNENTRDFWIWLRHMDLAPEWFRATYQESIVQFQESSIYNDPDLVNHVNAYVRDLHSGKRVLIVAHSQGNFYANNAYRRIRLEYPQYADNVGIVSVATPAAWVEGANNLGTSRPEELYYTTNSADLIINLVRAFFPNTLPPNPEEPFSTGYFQASHGFVDTYLNPEGPFRSLIRSHVLQSIDRIERPEIIFECLDPSTVEVNVDTIDATNISSSSAQLNGRVASGKEIAASFILQPLTSTNLSCATLNLPETGPLSTGDLFSGTFAVRPDTTYFYMACGREGDRVDSGATVSFRTPESAVPCGTPFSASGGTEGMDINYSMGGTAGSVLVEFQAYTIPDMLEIWQGGRRIYSTGDLVSGLHTTTIYHDPDNGLEWNIRVYGNSNSGTAWDLNISCPTGSRDSAAGVTTALSVP